MRNKGFNDENVSHSSQPFCVVLTTGASYQYEIAQGICIMDIPSLFKSILDVDKVSIDESQDG